MHLVYPRTFYIGIVFNSPWVLQSSQEKFWGVNKMHFGQCENGE